jgi:hypothetical protein
LKDLAQHTLAQHYTYETDWVQEGYNIVNEKNVKKRNNKPEYIAVML